MLRFRTLILLVIAATSATAQTLPRWITRGGGIYIYDVSPDGLTLTAGNGWGYRTWDITSGGMIASSEQPRSNAVIRIGTMVSPDGRYIALTGDNELVVEEVATGRRVASVPAFSPLHASFSPDGSLLHASTDLTSVLFRMPNLDTVREEGPGGAAFFSPDGTRQLRLEHEGLAMRDVASGSLIWRDTAMVYPRGYPWYEFADSGRVVVASNGTHLRFWDATTGDSIAHIADRLIRSNIRLFADPMERHIVTIGGPFDGDSTIKVYDAETLALVAKRPLDPEVGWAYEGAIVPRTTRMVLSGRDGVYHVIDYMSGEVIRRFPAGIGGSALFFGMSDDASAIATVDAFSRVLVGETTTGGLVRRMATPYFETNTFAMSGSGNLLAVGSTRNETTQSDVLLFNYAFGATIGAVNDPPRTFTATTFVGGPHRLLTVDDQGVLRVHLVQAGGIERTMTGQRRQAKSVVASPDGSTAAVLYDGKVDVWNLANGELLRTFAEPWSYKLIALSSDGRFLYAATHKPQVVAWNVRDSTRRVLTALDDSTLNSIVVSHDGDWLIAGGRAVSVVSIPADAVMQRLVHPQQSGPLAHLVAVDAQMRTIAATDGTDVMMWEVEKTNDIAGDRAQSAAALSARLDRHRQRLDVTVLSGARTDASVHVIDMLGRAVVAMPKVDLECGPNTLTIDVSALRAGVYIVVVEVDGRRKSLRFGLQ
jgi:WD40 repeat protein